jgi:hypothetical protein
LKANGKIHSTERASSKLRTYIEMMMMMFTIIIKNKKSTFKVP